MLLSETWAPDSLDPVLDFPVVAIGASAGGLEAVTEMVQNISDSTDMAFVLVLHLDPNHESLMAELLGRKTKLAVRQIEDGDRLQQNQLHIIPPGSSLRMDGGLLRLDPFEEPRGLRRPIDTFFMSLASTQGPRAASVILSGTGADGSSGMRAIKEMGGICVTQLPTEARYDGMPHAALATKLVDFALPANQIVKRLKAYFDGSTSPHFPEEEKAVVSLNTMFSILAKHSGHDFSGYKRATILRRLERRLQLLEFTTLDEYIELLRQNDDEKSALFHDFLINVTSFYRDPANFEALREKVIKVLFSDAKRADEIRIWVPGCSSGQEAYSIAMIVDEMCGDLPERPLVQIFATDIDDVVMDMARSGRYPTTVFSELPQRYQESYTILQEGVFEIAPKIRNMVRFSHHSLIKNAPFSKIDLISCRNLLIYLDDELQNDVLSLFHFSLRKGGYLFLGNSENVTRRSELFKTVDAKHHIFQARQGGKRPHIMLPLGSHGSPDPDQRPTSSVMPATQDFPRSTRPDIGNLAVYEAYAPPFVRVAEDGRIVDSSGELGLYLMAKPGEERHIYLLARDGLNDVVMPLLGDALSQNKRLALTNIEVTSQFGIQKTDVIAHPLPDGTAAIIFNARGRLEQSTEEYAVAPASRDQRIGDLQEELQTTRLLLKNKIEEVETTNEELKSSNEEMMSMNEELQSANEELTTANEELKNKISELSLANADLANFMQLSDLIMVVLDRSHRIRHLTEAAKRVLPLRSNDRGRAITEFRINLRDVDLADALNKVFESAAPFEQATRSEDGERHFLLRITPYFFADGSIEGATITLVDLTENTLLQNDLRIESQRLTRALEAGRMGHIELDAETGLFTIDKTVSDQFGLDGADKVPMEVLLRNADPGDAATFSKAIDLAVRKNQNYELTVKVELPDEEERWIRTNGLPHRAQDGTVRVVGPTIDVTAEHKEMLIKELTHQELNHRIKNLFAVIGSIVASAPKQNVEVEDYADALQARIKTLSRAYDLARDKLGAKGVDWKTLLERILNAHSANGQMTLSGPDVYVSSDNLTTLTLMIHEMATNALKYGAFSDPKGHLDVTWSVENDDEVVINWNEKVPNFRATETESGFGTRMIDLASKQLKGRLNARFEDDGKKIEFSFRLS